MNFKGLKYLWLVLLIFCARRGAAQDFIAGVRGGASFNAGAHHFRQVEVFGEMNLPWRWNFYSDWRLQPRFDLSAGWLNGEHADAFIGSLGPALELRKGKFPLTLEGGFSPTVLSRDRFGAKNFGDDFQFTSHIGLNWDITKHFSVGWRFQHMSNADLARPNPGLNLQMVSASYRF